MNASQNAIDHVNQHPLSQKASQLLEQEGERPDPNQLFLLQLIQQELDQKQVQFLPRWKDLLLETLALLERRPPQQVLDWFLKGPRDPEYPENNQELQVSEETQQLLQQEQSPAAFAAFLCQLLQNNLMEFLPEGW